MLPFAGSLGSLESAFHNFGSGVRRASPARIFAASPARTGYGKRRESVVNRTAKNGVLEWGKSELGKQEKRKRGF